MTFYALMLGCGLLWTLSYLMIIHRGFSDRTYGMPVVALCANVSWEFLFSFVYPQGPIQTPVNLAWFSLDLIICYQALRYGPSEFRGLTKGGFYAMFAFTLVAAFCAVLFVTWRFKDFDGAYTAFGQSLLMSALFIAMLRARRSLRGQSLPIAVCKLLGTGLASLAFYQYAYVSQGSVVLPVLFVSSFVLDAVYVSLVCALRRTGATRSAASRPAAQAYATRSGQE